MKTLASREDRHIVTAGSYFLSDAQPPVQRNPKTAALLSLLPGLGQLHNGEIGKGLLFLSVSLINLTLFALIFFGGPIMACLSSLAGQAHLALNSELLSSLEVGRAGSFASTLALVLMVSYVSYAMREAYDQAVAANRGAKFAPFFLGLPEATSGSYLFHFAVVACGMLMILFLVAPKPPQEQSTVIELVAPSPPQPKPRPKRPTEPKPVTPPKEIEPAKVEPPKPQTEPIKPAPVAVAIPTTTPAPLSVASPEASAPAVPQPSSSADSGSSESSSAGTASATKEVDFGAYVSEVQKRIKRTWYPPKGNESKRITVKFHIRANGEVFGVQLAESSGTAIADDAATAAVQQAAPFPPLPEGSPADILIKFTFDYNVFSGRGR